MIESIAEQAERWLDACEQAGPALSERDRTQIGYVLRELGVTEPDGHPYHAGGGFMQALVKALLVADGDNLGRLAVGFPVMANALRAYRHVVGGTERLVQIASAGR